MYSNGSGGFDRSSKEFKVMRIAFKFLMIMRDVQ